MQRLSGVQMLKRFLKNRQSRYFYLLLIIIYLAKVLLVTLYILITTSLVPVANQFPAISNEALIIVFY